MVQFFYILVYRKIDGFTLTLEYQIGNLMPHNTTVQLKRKYNMRIIIAHL